MIGVLEQLMQKDGAYSLPWLVKIWSPETEGEAYPLYFVNSRTDVVYDGNTYTAASFRYTPNTLVLGMDGGGTLEIAAQESNLFEFIEYFDNVRLDIVGVLREATGEIEPVQSFSHTYGSIEGDLKTIKFTFDRDERLDMTFPALIWNNYNNRGNS